MSYLKMRIIDIIYSTFEYATSQARVGSCEESKRVAPITALCAIKGIYDCVSHQARDYRTAEYEGFTSTGIWGVT